MSGSPATVTNRSARPYSDRPSPRTAAAAATPRARRTTTANIIGTLIEKTGLKVPTSYIYKKFSIPKPEGGEEIAQPPQQNAGFGGLPFKQTPPMSAISLKAGGEPGHGTQERVDLLADVAIKKSAGTFKKAFGPVLKLIEKAESLEELRDMMENTDTVAAVFKEMDVTDVEELLQKVMIYADLEGRALEHGRN